jgi:hypothetical protein
VSVIRGADGLGVRPAAGAGLTPPTAISVEPNGIPTRPTNDVKPVPDGVTLIGAGPAREPPPLAEQLPDALAARPALVPMPADAADEAAHIGGLTPGVASSVAPIGMPVGATGEPGPSPSGVVEPSGEPEMLIPAVCARAAPQPKKIAATAVAATRFITRSISFAVQLLLFNVGERRSSICMFLLPLCRPCALVSLGSH